MSKPFIFISCGQFTDEEKSLGKAIVKIAKSLTGMDTFFAEDVQDLSGLDSNVLCALRDCAAFITVLHPRGSVRCPDGFIQTRASVWIEQEIAIATYIQRVENRPLPVAAFIHESVGREGLRDLLHLNPIRFTDATQVLAALPELLQTWSTLSPTGVRLEMQPGNQSGQEEHTIRRVIIKLVNDTNRRITSFTSLVRIPTGLLKHWSAHYPQEVASDDRRHRCFRLDETVGPVYPRATGHLITLEYCTQCAADETKDAPHIAPVLVDEYTIEATAWVDNREYRVSKTIKELALTV